MSVSNDAVTHPTGAQAFTHAPFEAATTAGHAPSLHTTQPCRCRLSHHVLDPRPERSRVLDVGDPDGRLATVSCGAALHHARMSLAAQGWNATVARRPVRDDPDHLAPLHVDGRAPIDLSATQHVRTVSLRPSAAARSLMPRLGRMTRRPSSPVCAGGRR